jgi:hypothetical protein
MITLIGIGFDGIMIADWKYGTSIIKPPKLQEETNAPGQVCKVGQSAVRPEASATSKQFVIVQILLCSMIRQDATMPDFSTMRKLEN